MTPNNPVKTINPTSRANVHPTRRPTCTDARSFESFCIRFRVEGPVQKFKLESSPVSNGLIEAPEKVAQRAISSPSPSRRQPTEPTHLGWTTSV